MAVLWVTTSFSISSNSDHSSTLKIPSFPVLEQVAVVDDEEEEDLKKLRRINQKAAKLAIRKVPVINVNCNGERPFESDIFKKISRGEAMRFKFDFG